MRSGIRLKDAISEFLAGQVRRKLSANTVRRSATTLRRFERAIGSSVWVGRVTPGDIENYFFGSDGICASKEDGSPLEGSTINLYVSTVRNFFDWCCRMGYLDLNPAAQIDRISPGPGRDFLRLTPTELLAVLDAAAMPRDRMALALAMHTGLRQVDIRHIQVGSISFEAGYMKVFIHKSKVWDEKPLTAELVDELKTWLNCYAELAGLPSRLDIPLDWYLLPGVRYDVNTEKYVIISTDSPLGPISRVASNTLHRMGYPSRMEGFHAFRRAAARALFESLQEDGAGRDKALMIVQDFLNHKSMIQTERYLGLSFERRARDNHLRGRSFLAPLAAREVGANVTSINTAKGVSDGSDDAKAV